MITKRTNISLPFEIEEETHLCICLFMNIENCMNITHGNWMGGAFMTQQCMTASHSPTLKERKHRQLRWQGKSKARWWHLAPALSQHLFSFLCPPHHHFSFSFYNSNHLHLCHVCIMKLLWIKYIFLVHFSKKNVL